MSSLDMLPWTSLGPLASYRQVRNKVKEGGYLLSTQKAHDGMRVVDRRDFWKTLFWGFNPEKGKGKRWKEGFLLLSSFFPVLWQSWMKSEVSTELCLWESFQGTVPQWWHYICYSWQLDDDSLKPPKFVTEAYGVITKGFLTIFKDFTLGRFPFRNYERSWINHGCAE